MTVTENSVKGSMLNLECALIWKWFAHFLSIFALYFKWGIYYSTVRQFASLT